MAIPKWVKTTFFVIVLVILAPLILRAVYFPLIKLGIYHYRYIERDPEQMINRLERIFDIDFPEDIKKVKVARTRVHWDGVVGFIVKFTAEPNVVDGFLKIKYSEPYTRERDNRDSCMPKPKWFTEPIKQGKTGDIYLASRQDKTLFRGEVYIDTEDKKQFVVYIHGGYESEWDK